MITALTPIEMDTMKLCQDHAFCTTVNYGLKCHWTASNLLSLVKSRPTL